jgi:hypothetical protein
MPNNPAIMHHMFLDASEIGTASRTDNPAKQLSKPCCPASGKHDRHKQKITDGFFYESPTPNADSLTYDLEDKPFTG